jgi:hypothetical protein
MAQLGHTDPGFTLRVYAHAMRRDEGDKERLKALVEGRDWVPMGTERPNHRPDQPAESEPENDEATADAGASEDGRGGFRTCDLSRVKRDPEPDEQPPEQGRFFRSVGRSSGSRCVPRRGRFPAFSTLFGHQCPIGPGR